MKQAHDLHVNEVTKDDVIDEYVVQEEAARMREHVLKEHDTNKVVARSVSPYSSFSPCPISLPMFGRTAHSTWSSSLS